MSDFDQAQEQTLSVVDDAPPTQPQGLPEAPKLQDVQQAASITMRDKAVALAKMGFRVLPVKPGTKAPAQPPNKPRPPKGRYHQYIPSRDPADVAAMWTGPNGESLGFDLGINTEGLLVLDIDDRDGRTGSASFDELVRMHGLDPHTVVASTPSGGRHYFYRLPADIDPTTVKFGSDKLGSGIDHRSYNSLVVGAGTVRPGKGEYRWVRSPAEYEMKETPRWLVDRCRREAPKKDHDVVPGLEIDSPDAMERFRRYAKNNAPEAIQNAGGRNATIAVLRRAGDYGLSYFVATEILGEEGGWNETKAIPPWDESELLELAKTLEPSRERPIGCEHPAAQFEAVPVLSNLPPLTLAEWKARDLPPPDYICGNWLSTTNRVLLVAPTGLGKTMFGVGLIMAIASNRDFLHWKGRRPAKVLFIDGEMSNRLLRRRLLDEAQRLGVAPETFYALSHEDVPNLAPLNTAQGQAFVNAVIEKLGGVDLIEFDNTMSLIAGDHREEEGWRQILPWVLSLTRRGIGQIWVHHTGHDESRTYGTKTREWQMDTVIHLERVKRADTDVSFALQFRKARERTPETQNEFKTARVALINNKWTVANVTGFEDPIPATPLQIEWWEKLEAWTEDERERLGLSPDADIPITVEVARKVLFATEDSENDGPSFDRKGASRQNIRDRMTEMTVKGLLRKIARGKWVIVKDAQ
jgi:Bifunctional DNA primase/polymerase, N-terminal/AAA domain